MLLQKKSKINSIITIELGDMFKIAEYIIGKEFIQCCLSMFCRVIPMWRPLYCSVRTRLWETSSSPQQHSDQRTCTCA